MPGRPPLMFLHVPKTGGSTLHLILRRHYPKERVYRIVERDPQWTVSHLLELPPERRDALEFIQGHVHYGFHTGFSQPFRYVTLLRRPADRLYSHYRHIVRWDHQPLHRPAREMPIGEFLKSGLMADADNRQTRALCGDAAIPFGATSREHLRRAKENLEHGFLAFGVTERFDELALRLHRLLGGSGYPCYLVRNASAGRSDAHALPEATRRLLAELNELDAELYSFATDRLGPETGHRAFTAANLAYRVTVGPVFEAWRAYGRARIWLGRERRRAFRRGRES